MRYDWRTRGFSARLRAAAETEPHVARTQFGSLLAAIGSNSISIRRGMPHEVQFSNCSARSVTFVVRGTLALTNLF